MIFETIFEGHARYKWTFKNKYYVHFDSEFCKDRVNSLIDDIQRKGRISHPFYPFIKIALPKVRRSDNGSISIDWNKKPRYIFHTARIDSNIYSLYRSVLMNDYEITLKNLGIGDCVIAYRKISIAGEEKRKCNVHFANEAIDEIKRQLLHFSKCSAIAMDITDFFGSLDHNTIKRQWCRVMGFGTKLPDDHFSIFKHITKYISIDADKLEKMLGVSFSELRKEKKIQLCTPTVYRNKVAPTLRQIEKNKIGIPQGTPISDAIANIYMLDFDVLMKKFADKYKGYYRRYSDDILLILPAVNKDKALNFIRRLTRIVGKTLRINDKKTLVSDFEQIDAEIKVTSYKNIADVLTKVGRPFEYLGISFDGVHKQLRQSTISAFYVRLCQRIKAEVAIASSKLNEKGTWTPDAEQLYKMVNFAMIYDEYMKKRVEENGKFRGNFYTYVCLVANVTGNSTTKKIVDNLMPWIKKRARKYCNSIVSKRYKEGITAMVIIKYKSITTMTWNI